MRLRFLGTGTSFGVPQVGCACDVCRSEDPRDKRTRVGALLESDGLRLLIDTPPELRLQLIAAGVDRVDAVLFTHDHADHTHGIDDIRSISVRRDGALRLVPRGRRPRPRHARHGHGRAHHAHERVGQPALGAGLHAAFVDLGELAAPHHRGQEGRQEAQAEMQKLIRLASTAFFDAWLKGSDAADKWLSDGGFTAQLGEMGVFEQK